MENIGDTPRAFNAEYPENAESQLIRPQNLQTTPNSEIGNFGQPGVPLQVAVDASYGASYSQFASESHHDVNTFHDGLRHQVKDGSGAAHVSVPQTGVPLQQGLIQYAPWTPHISNQPQSSPTMSHLLHNSSAIPSADYNHLQHNNIMFPVWDSLLLNTKFSSSVKRPLRVTEVKHSHPSSCNL